MENQTEEIGDGQLPNKYWVTICNDHYITNEHGGLDWESLDVKSKTFGPFKTYIEAHKFIKENNLMEMLHYNSDARHFLDYDGITIHSIWIEDRISGEIWFAVLSERATYEVIEHEDVKFTEKKLGRSIKNCESSF